MRLGAKDSQYIDSKDEIQKRVQSFSIQCHFEMVLLLRHEFSCLQILLFSNYLDMFRHIYTQDRQYF